MRKKLKIAIIAPPFATIPPKGQGGTERIAYQMTEGLSEKNHAVTLFGAGKYKGKADYVQIFKKTISERKNDNSLIESSRALRIETAYIAKVMGEIAKRKDFDVIFNHCRGGYLFLPLAEYIEKPIITILHLPLFKESAEVFSAYKKPNLVTISDSQRKGFSNINYLATVYNGVPLSEFKFQEKPSDYFLFMGALGEHKNPKEAILASKKAGVKLIIAGGKKREPYFSEEIKPLIDNKQIRYVGSVSGKKRTDLFRQAKGFLFPIKWEEPFGLVMAEAMACGTPVIAYPKGAVREVVENKKTGFIVRNAGEMAKAIKDIDKIDRKKCRERVEKYFSTEKMVEDYEKLCYKVTK